MFFCILRLYYYFIMVLDILSEIFYVSEYRTIEITSNLTKTKF